MLIHIWCVCITDNSWLSKLVYYYAAAPNRRLSDVLFDVWRLSDVCLSRTSGVTREQEAKTKIGTDRALAHVTWLGHHFQGKKVRGQGHQAALPTHRGLNT